MIENSKGYKTFLVFDYFMVALLALICLLPMIHILAVSLSDRVANTAGMVTFLIASLFSGGLIPTYLVVKNVHLLNSFWAMIIPCAVPIGNVILMLNFFRGLPKELEEAALLDGAGHLSVLLRVYVPLSKPSIATVTLFSMVGHWNSWFDGMIYLRDDTLQPLATLLHNMVSRTTLNVIMETTDISVIEQLLTVTNESLKSAQLFIGMLPILCVYPFIQKYFTKGLVIGSVKG